MGKAQALLASLERGKTNFLNRLLRWIGGWPGDVHHPDCTRGGKTAEGFALSWNTISLLFQGLLFIFELLSPFQTRQGLPRNT